MLELLSRRALLLSLLGGPAAFGIQQTARSKASRPLGKSLALRATMEPLAKPAGTVRLLLTGDVMLGRGVDQVLPHQCNSRIYESCVQDARDYVALAVAANGPLPPPAQRSYAYPWGFALGDMEAHAPDVRLINLETAVTNHKRPWPSKGINYRMHPGNVPTLTAAGINVASLANNHSLDWCREGLLETLTTLQHAGIQVVGAGRDAAEAQRPAIVQLPPQPSAGAGAQIHPGPGSAHPEPGDGSSGSSAPAGAAATAAAAGCGGPRVLIWGVGHESSGVPDEWAARAGMPGVFVTDLSPEDMELLGKVVAAEKREGDVAVVSVHWGSNWGFEVPKMHRRFARALIDSAGVDLVHGHSSHHAKGCEVYQGKLIIYGAGDLISDYEGISNAQIEAYYPSESYRDDVGLLWYADVSTEDGTLRQLSLTPTRLRHLHLEPPDPGDLHYIQTTMDRECRKLGGYQGVRRVQFGDSVALLLNFDSSKEE